MTDVDFAVTDEVIRTVGEGTFGKVVECRDLKRLVTRWCKCTNNITVILPVVSIELAKHYRLYAKLHILGVIWANITAVKPYNVIGRSLKLDLQFRSKIMYRQSFPRDTRSVYTRVGLKSVV